MTWRISNRLGVFFLAIAFAGWVPLSTRAAVVNGNFDAGSTGWTTSDGTFVSFTGGQAVLLEHTLDNEVWLAQQFDIPAGSLNLSFDLIDLVTEADSGFLPDAFNVALLDPITLLSIVPSVDAFSDAFYTRDLLNGVTQGIRASGVTLTPASTSLPLTVNLDIAAVADRAALLQFKLIGGGLAHSSSVRLDNIKITAVPEPASWLVVPALAALANIRRRRRARLLRVVPRGHRT